MLPSLFRSGFPHAVGKGLEEWSDWANGPWRQPYSEAGGCRTGGGLADAALAHRALAARCLGVMPARAESGI